MQMRDGLRSWLRTTVPAVWAWLLVQGAELGLPAGLVDALGEAEGAVTVVAIAAVYATLRAVEPHMPPVLTRVLLGSNQSPSYLGPDSTGPNSTAPRTPTGVRGIS